MDRMEWETLRGLSSAAITAAHDLSAAISALEPAAPAPEPEPANVHVCPIDPTDGRDVTAELTEWLQSLPDGATADMTSEDPDAIFRCETPVKLVEKAGLVIRNLRLYRTDRQHHGGVVYPKPNPHLWLLEADGCRVEGLTVHGTNDTPDQRAGFGAYNMYYEFEAAIRMERFTDCAVVDLDADAVWGDGVQWQIGRGAHMSDCRIDRNGRQGVTVICSDFLAERVHVEHSRRSGFDFEPDRSDQACENIEVRESYTNTIGVAFASAGRGQVNDVWLHHNTSAGPSVPVVTVRPSDGSRRHDWRFEDHEALGGLGSPAAAAAFANVDNLAVRRVRLPVVEGQSRLAVGMTSCGGVCEIADNDFGPGGDRYFNRTPEPGQQLTVTGNAPTLALVD